MGIPDQPLYEIKADLFKGLAHPFRIRILELLSGAPEVSVAQMLTDMGLEASHLSQHLAVLRRHRLVTSQRRGSHVYYQLTSPHGAELLSSARALLGDLLQVSAAQLEQAAHLPPPGMPGGAQPAGQGPSREQVPGPAEQTAGPAEQTTRPAERTAEQAGGR